MTALERKQKFLHYVIAKLDSIDLKIRVSAHWNKPTDPTGQMTVSIVNQTEVTVDYPTSKTLVGCSISFPFIDATDLPHAEALAELFSEIASKNDIPRLVTYNSEFERKEYSILAICERAKDLLKEFG